MEWATNPAGDHVSAGTPEAYGFALRCPVCKAPVYHRSGAYNRPHFAHYSGNSNRECDLYDPRKDGQGGASYAQPRHLTPSGVGIPALIWVDGGLSSLSLRLRLPKFPNGYASKLMITSSRGTRILVGDELMRTVFVLVPLREPPAKVKTNPSDIPTEVRIEEVLSQFRLSGNYFRRVANGGVLESPDAALELGEEYFYVSQHPLPEPAPSALGVTELSKNREWWVYRALLRDRPGTRSEDIAELEFYLGRNVHPPKPRLEIVWPPACRFDTDGTAVFADTMKQFVVRSDGGLPNIGTGSGAKPAVSDLGKGYYQVTLSTPEEEMIVWMSSGASQRLRFEKAPLATPKGVMLTTSTGRADLTSIFATKIAGQFGPVEVSVPWERLWRNARLNGNRLNPVPNGDSFTFDGPIPNLKFGSFGSIGIVHQANVSGIDENPWYSKIERIVAASVGFAAMEGMKSIRRKRQAVRWAVENDAMCLLPLVLFALSSEVNRGVS